MHNVTGIREVAAVGQLSTQFIGEFMVINLTQKFIDAGLTVSGKQKIEYVDDNRSGLYILVSAMSQPEGTYFWRTKNSSGITAHLKIGKTSDISLAAARAEVKRLRGEQATGNDHHARGKAKRAIPTLTDFFNDTYLPHAKVHKRSWKRDVQLFARIKEKFGNQRLDQITKQQVSVFHANLLEGGLSASGADHHPKMLRRLYSMCLEYGLLDKNPLANFKLFNHDNKVEHYLDDKQLNQLMDVLRTDANRTVCNIAILLLGTGCRLNEILSAKKSDIDVENRVLKIAASNSKSKRIRTVPLNDASLDIINLQIEDTKKYDPKENDYLFVNHQTGQPYTTIMKVWTRLRNKAGLPHLRIHDLRHSFASFLVNSGRTLYEVQQILGHSQSIVTERYAHLSTKTLQDASNSASVIIRGAIASSMQPKLVEQVETLPMHVVAADL
jgi:site-specific recombinase XerD